MRTDSLTAGIFKCLQHIFFFSSVVLFLIGHILLNNDILLVSLFLLSISSIIYSIFNFKGRFLILFFQIACIFFLYGRNIIKLFYGEPYGLLFSYEINQLIISLIYVAVFFILFGAYVAENFKKNSYNITNYKLNERSKSEYVKNLKIVSFSFYLITIFCTFLVEIEQFFIFKDLDYAAMYTHYESSLPSFVLSISALSKFFLCLFLSTFPKKFIATITLVLYVLSTAPVFILGQRNSFISAVLFSVCYYILRDIFRKDNEKKWFGKFETTAIIVAIPLGLAFLSIYEAIRLNEPITNVNIFKSIENLFRSQGVTYDVIGKGLVYQDVLPKGNINYTFGQLIEYFKSNSISQFLFNTKSFPTQTYESAMFGNNLADSLGYLDLGAEYFNGAGLGSSFIIENYIDFGIGGVGVFSAFIGFMLRKIPQIFNKNLFFSYISLIIILQIFMLPRASSTTWAKLLFYIPMLLVCVFVYILTSLLIKKYYFEKR